MLALQVVIAGQALHHRKDHGKHVLAHGLAVGAHRARQFGVGRHGAGGQVIVIARGLQLQQLEVLTRGKQGRVYVAQDYVGIGDLLTRDGVGARVDKVLARSARLQELLMSVVDGQRNQDVHKQSSPLQPTKKGQVYFGRFYQAKRSNKNAGCKTSVPWHPAHPRLPAQQLVAVLGHNELYLALGRITAVLGAHTPTVTLTNLDVGRSGVDHGLDGKDHARSHDGVYIGRLGGKAHRTGPRGTPYRCRVHRTRAPR